MESERKQKNMKEQGSKGEWGRGWGARESGGEDGTKRCSMDMCVNMINIRYSLYENIKPIILYNRNVRKQRRSLKNLGTVYLLIVLFAR